MAINEAAEYHVSQGMHAPHSVNTSACNRRDLANATRQITARACVRVRVFVCTGMCAWL